MKPCKKCGSTNRQANGNCSPCNVESSRAWRLKNKSKILAYNAKKDKKDNRRRASEWNKANPAKRSNERAKSLGVEGTFTNEEWKKLCNSTGNKCLKCGDTNQTITVDHVIPLSRGGTNYIENIQPLCKKCNSRKHTSTKDYRPGATKSIDNPEQLSLWQS